MNITKTIRCEIISSIATLVMVHTMEPTPEQYTILSERLVKEYPILADGYGCGYVSYYTCGITRMCEEGYGVWGGEMVSDTCILPT